MSRFAEGLPSCPGCGSADTCVTPSQAHPYLCLNCGRVFGLAEPWEG